MTVSGALYGGNIKTSSRYGDLQNRISIGTAAAFTAKDYFKEHEPYSVMTTSFSELDPYLNESFQIAVLRHLLYDVPLSMSGFTRVEELFWTEFREYQLGIAKTGDLLTAIMVLNDWLVIEVLNGVHSSVRPTYTSTFTTTYINYHFLVELRRQLAGDIADNTSTFSPEEIVFYEDYNEHVDGILKYGDTLIAVKELDNWLMREITNDLHHMLERDYELTHKWRKTLNSDD